ncbi:acyl-coenzyme A--6-aminopenicillanic-acid-acyltransferase form, partial [Kribbella turkmenica]
MIDTIDISAADPRERGRQYGEAARAHIAASVAFYTESVAHKTGLSWPEVQNRAGAWLPIIEGYLPGIVPELRGIADGSGHRFEEIVALNSRGELTRGNPFETPARPGGCS